MAQVTKQAVLKRSPCIELGDSLAAYMSDLGLSVTGGRWGSIARLREHLAPLLTCSISCTSEQTGAWVGMAIDPVEEARLWWDAKQPDHSSGSGDAGSEPRRGKPEQKDGQARRENFERDFHSHRFAKCPHPKRSISQTQVNDRPCVCETQRMKRHRAG